MDQVSLLECLAAPMKRDTTSTAMLANRQRSCASACTCTNCERRRLNMNCG